VKPIVGLKVKVGANVLVGATVLVGVSVPIAVGELDKVGDDDGFFDGSTIVGIEEGDDDGFSLRNISLSPSPRLFSNEGTADGVSLGTVVIGDM